MEAPANAEIVEIAQRAGRCWDDSNKAHFCRRPTAGRPAERHALKLDEAEFTEHFDPEREDLCPVENHGQDGVGHPVYLTPSRGGAAWSTSGVARFEDETTGRTGNPPNATSRTGARRREAALLLA